MSTTTATAWWRQWQRPHSQLVERLAEEGKDGDGEGHASNSAEPTSRYKIMVKTKHPFRMYGRRGPPPRLYLHLHPETPTFHPSYLPTSLSSCLHSCLSSGLSSCLPSGLSSGLPSCLPSWLPPCLPLPASHHMSQPSCQPTRQNIQVNYHTNDK
jgi:hypothetical protein